MPKLREGRFSNFEVVCSDEVSLYLRALVWGFEVTPLGRFKEITDSMKEERGY